MAYLAGIYSSPRAAQWGQKFGREKVLPLMLLVMWASLALMLLNQLAVVLVGLLIFTFAFFAAHSLCSSWVTVQSLQYRAVGSSLYLFCYYLGSSVLGSGSGLIWERWDWPGLLIFIASLLLLGLILTLYLKKLSSTAPTAQIKN